MENCAPAIGVECVVLPHTTNRSSPNSLFLIGREYDSFLSICRCRQCKHSKTFDYPNENASEKSIKSAPEHHELIITRNNLSESETNSKRVCERFRRHVRRHARKRIATAIRSHLESIYTSPHSFAHHQRLVVVSSYCSYHRISLNLNVYLFTYASGSERVHLPQIHMTSKREQWDKMYEANINRRRVDIPTFFVSNVFSYTTGTTWLVYMYSRPRITTADRLFEAPSGIVSIFWLANDHDSDCCRRKEIAAGVASIPSIFHSRTFHSNPYNHKWFYAIPS